MCLVFIAVSRNSKYKLVLASNRDEFYNRKTAPAHFWEDHPFVVGGRDLEAAGTWMAMTRTGKIGLVTNYRDPTNINPGAPSRGKLVSDFLVNGDSPDYYIKEVSKKGSQYNGFNLITGTINDLWYYSNYGKGIQPLTPGIYGLSNHLLDTAWPKVIRGKENFTRQLSNKEIAVDAMLNMLYDEERAADSALPDTGIGLERERALSSMFIKTKGYGTRCSTVVLVTHNNEVTYAERVYDLNTFQYTTQEFKFRITESPTV